MPVIIALCVIVLVLLLMTLNALRFTPKKAKPVQPMPVDIKFPYIDQHLSKMIRCKTVSGSDENLEAEFERFRELLKELYPKVHEVAPPKRLGDSGILFCIKGKSRDKSVVLMSHYDVVPADANAWEKPPYDGIIENGIIWGRGTLDTKATLCAVMEATEALLSRGFEPQNDIYLAFSGDEEITGASAPAIVDYLYDSGVRPMLVLDEGGAVVTGGFPGVTVPAAMIGTGEKGRLDVTLTAKSSGGHASMPPVHTALGHVAKAVADIEKRPFPRRISLPVIQMFDNLGRHSTFGYKLIFANLHVTASILDMICKRKGGELNAMVRTTCAATMATASPAVNVLPPAASVSLNLRLMNADSIDIAKRYLKAVINNDGIEITELYGMNACPISEVSGDGWDCLCTAIGQTWEGAVISPYLMMACSDSRHYTKISKNVYRFSAMELSSDERKLIHGHNERIPAAKLVKTAEFYIRLINSLQKV